VGDGPHVRTPVHRDESGRRRDAWCKFTREARAGDVAQSPVGEREDGEDDEARDDPPSDEFERGKPVKGLPINGEETPENVGEYSRDETFSQVVAIAQSVFFQPLK
jgi:hypothetical protein